jgi:ubiquinone/menaquinone biosynthesis C-methylase UbiE
VDYALPDLYDALYAFKDYEGEAARLTTLIRERNPQARSLLDVACGTGKHLEQFQGTFDDVEGVDIHEGLLAIARRRLGSVRLHVGDMRTLDLGRRFDAVTCLFSAIGHTADVDELDAAIAAMAKHLEPGGILVVEPWLEPDAWVEGRLHLLTVDEPELKIARMTMAGRRGTTSILDFHYLVGTPDGFETSDEQMELALFTTAEQLRAFELAGLQAEHDPEGLMDRGLLIGRAA